MNLDLELTLKDPTEGSSLKKSKPNPIFSIGSMDDNNISYIDLRKVRAIKYKNGLLNIHLGNEAADVAVQNVPKESINQLIATWQEVAEFYGENVKLTKPFKINNLQTSHNIDYVKQSDLRYEA